MNTITRTILSSAALAVSVGAASAQVTTEPPMLDTQTPATSNGWEVTPIFTVSEFIGGYQPVGILDGTAAFRRGQSQTRATILVNHELNPGNGYSYTLKNGTVLTGARVSAFEIRRNAAPALALGGNAGAQIDILGAGLAYDTAYDRSYQEVVDASQINETGNADDGFARLCSSMGVAKGTYGFVDDIYLTGEETGKPFHPHGGSEWVIDVRKREIWAAPALGRGAWENVTPLETGDEDTVALLMGDDTASAPLYLFVGEKNGVGDESFLDRNGLKQGKLYAWKSDAGDLDPQTFNGLNSSRTGTFVEVTVLDAAMAGQPGYDAAGYADIDTLQGEADALGCFSFSRPEDLATNPLDGTQAVFASTGRGQLFPADNWGTTYIVDVDFSNLTAELVIVHDADGLPVPDAGIRSPDNLDWASDGKVYIQEDRSTSPSSLFGAATGIEASIWQLDPITRATTRIAEIDRSVVVPAGTTDIGAGQIGHWESSGVLDVSGIFRTLPGERLLIATVQAHGIRDGAIGDNPLLDEGGQLVFLRKVD
jgi:secreted PhoX family phosphatase